MRRPLLFTRVALSAASLNAVALNAAVLNAALGIAALGTLTASAAAAPRRPPVVVELFTAQGCASCIPADKTLADLGERKGVIPLTLPVDYWDYLGWADTFAEPAFTERQRAYDRRLKVREIYTPEIIVDGRKEAPGLDKDAIDAAIQADGRELANGPKVALLKGGAEALIHPGLSPAPRADVWLVRYDPQPHTVKVKAGDNRGKSVTQRYVVRELTRLGGYRGGVRSYRLPKPASDGLSTLVLVQGVRGGGIYGVGEG